MLKNKNGITLITLVITIIVMGVILGITITTADDLLRETYEKRMKTNLYLIRARAETLLDDYLFDGTDNLGRSELSENVSKFDWENDTSKYIYREWTSVELKKQGIEVGNVAENEIFIIQYDIINEEVDIATINGVEDADGFIRYTLSSLEDR